MDLVLFATFVVGRDGVTPDKKPESVGRVREGDAEICGLRTVDADRHLRLADVQRRVGVDHARDLLDPGEKVAAVSAQFTKLRPLKHELDASSARATAPADVCANTLRREGGQYVVSHLRHDRKLITRTRLDRLELHVYGGAVLRAGTVAGDGHERVIDLRDAADRCGNPARHDVSRLNARPFGCPHADVET